MRTSDHERLALECLRQAVIATSGSYSSVVALAEKFYAFVSGEAADDAKAKLEAVRAAVKG